MTPGQTPTAGRARRSPRVATRRPVGVTSRCGSWCAARSARRRRSPPRPTRAGGARIHPDQLPMLVDGHADHVYVYSFIATDIVEQSAVGIEHFHRHRAQIEERLKDAKLGAALRRMPSADHNANRTWMTACLRALNLAPWSETCPRPPARQARRPPTRRCAGPPRPCGEASSASPRGPSPPAAERCSGRRPATATATCRTPPTTPRSRSRHPDRPAVAHRRRCRAKLRSQPPLKPRARYRPTPPIESPPTQSTAHAAAATPRIHRFAST